MAEKESNGVRVCVTGGAGFIGSWLVRKLLEKGYTVHATLRNTGDEAKAGLLRRLVPGAAERLRLFQADLFDAATFAPAIVGCQFVFLVATPFGLDSAGSQQYKSTAEAAVDAVRAILRQCEESRTVKRVIHTASVAAASPLLEREVSASGVGYRDFIDESCWTSLNVDYPLRSAHFDKYILSKLQSEQELLSYNNGESPAFEVVTLPLGLVAGNTVLGRAPETVESAVAPVSRSEPYFGLLRILQQLLGSLPLVHVDDVCDALGFCMERRPSVAGRFLCAAAYPTIHDVVAHYASKFPHLDILKETEAVATVRPARDRLGELGFKYKYGMEEILDSSVACAARLGSLDASKLGLQKA